MGYKMMVFMSKRMIACDEASFLVSYKHDNRLGFRRWWQLKMHLITCHLCRKYARQIEELEHAVEKYRAVTSHEPCLHHLSEEVCSKMKLAVESELNAK